ncbi:uncharacterized protein LOC127804258 [Diospyros lotus]|uniref:uncharacterized protein LOC127804258 n=1 Tax=Diospyros lotus TaxID=55363 RepID=UPI00224D6D93|nr:uncharacterized protein LOC127804258 [Diospyros lotus]
MEEDRERKFVCKICGKSFPGGKSLGGHMRGHLPKNSAKKHQDSNETGMDLGSGGGAGCGLAGKPNKDLGVSDSTLAPEKLKSSQMDPSYGLRENPKKSWRMVDEEEHRIEGKENCCKECGKEFPSLKALSGHMRCHSIKAREDQHVCKQCGKGFDSIRALFGHMRHHPKRSVESPESQSDFVAPCPIHRKRSRTRYQNSESFSLSSLNGSSDVSEIDEVEEAAMTLMMLYKGVTNWVEFNKDFVSSQNCSESETSKGKRLQHRSKGGNILNADEARKTKKRRGQLDSCVSFSGNSLLEKNGPEVDDLDSGFMSNKEKKIGLEGSVCGFRECDEIKKPELDDESGTQLSDLEIENGSKFTGVELGKELVREVGFDQAASEILESNSIEEACYDIQDPKLGEISCGGISHIAPTSEDL